MARKSLKTLKISGIAVGITIIGFSISPSQGNVRIVQDPESTNPFVAEQVILEVPEQKLLGSIVFEDQASEIATDLEKGPSPAFEIISTSENAYQTMSGGDFEIRSEIGYNSGTTLSGGDFALSAPLFPLPEILQLPGDDLWILD